MKQVIKILSKTNDLQNLLEQNKAISDHFAIETVDAESDAEFFIEDSQQLIIKSNGHIIKTFKKPFQIAEVYSLLKPKENLNNSTLKYGEIELDFGAMTVSSDKFISDLTEKEMQILQILIQNQGEVVSKKQVMQDVWQYQSDVDTKTLETHMYRLRKKIEPYSDMIKTQKHGYSINIYEERT